MKGRILYRRCEVTLDVEGVVWWRRGKKGHSLQLFGGLNWAELALWYHDSEEMSRGPRCRFGALPPDNMTVAVRRIRLVRHVPLTCHRPLGLAPVVEAHLRA